MKKKEFLKIVRTSEVGTTNADFMAMYVAQTGQTDFRTFKQWKESGYKVRKGEKSFPLWSRPIGSLKAAKDKNYTPDDSEMKRFGVCHLFHAGQVDKI